MWESGHRSGGDQVDHYLGEDPGSDGRGRTYKCCSGFRPYTLTISNFLGRSAAALLRQVSTGATSSVLMTLLTEAQLLQLVSYGVDDHWAETANPTEMAAAIGAVARRRWPDRRRLRLPRQWLRNTLRRAVRTVAFAAQLSKKFHDADRPGICGPRLLGVFRADPATFCARSRIEQRLRPPLPGRPRATKSRGL
jgi:hypothetical protein